MTWSDKTLVWKRWDYPEPGFLDQQSEVYGLKNEARLCLWIFRSVKTLQKVLILNIPYLYTIMASVASTQAREAGGSFHPNPFHCFLLLPPPAHICILDSMPPKNKKNKQARLPWGNFYVTFLSKVLKVIKKFGARKGKVKTEP